VTKEVAAAVGGLKDLVPTGTSVLIEGELTEAPAKAKQVLRRQSALCSIILTCRILTEPLAAVGHTALAHSKNAVACFASLKERCVVWGMLGVTAEAGMCCLQLAAGSGSESGVTV